MEPIPRGRGCVGTQLAACGAAFQLWERSTQSPIYHEQYRSGKLQFPEGNEKGLVPRGRGSNESLVPEGKRTV